MRGPTQIIAMLFLIAALAGCAKSDASTDDSMERDANAAETKEQDSEPSTDEEPDGESKGDEPSSGTGSDPDEPAATPLAISSFEASIQSGTTPFSVDFSFDGTGDDVAWSLDADGDGTADVDGSGFPGNATFEYASAGSFNATLTASSGAQDVNKTLVILAEAAPADEPFDSGHIESSSTGAVAQADIGRTQFEITGARSVLEVTTYMEDPAAKEAGQTYTVRFTPPSGGNNDYDATYGSTITIADPEVGTWEIGVFMVAAGSFDWTADWCAFSGDSCPA